MKKPFRMSVAQMICRPLPPFIAQKLREVIYPTKAGLTDSYEFVAAGQTGSLLKSTTADYHGYRFAVHGYFEWRNVAIARALCAPGDTIVEIGANIGTETFAYADIAGPSGKVYAFEPVPSNLKSLEASLELNGLNNVEILPWAVADRCGSLKFSAPTKVSQSGLGHLVVENGHQAAETIEVQCVSLDSMSDRIGRASAIFVDVEGAEGLVLRGAQSYLKQHRPAIVLEADVRWLARAGFTSADLMNELKSCSYDVHRIGRLGLDSTDSAGLDPKDTVQGSNWLCLHSDSARLVSIVNSYLRACGLFPCLAGLNPLSGRKLAQC